MSSTVGPKSIHYHSNGSGRDQYITTTCGGLFRNKPEKCSGFEIGTFGKKAPYKPINNYLPAKHLHYHSDGTGRDKYIIVDEGGLAGRSYKRYNYINNLRTYPKRKEPLKDDIFTRSQSTFYSSKQQFRQSELSRTQQSTSSRLSQPKITLDPYAELRASTTLPGLRRVY